MALPRDPAVRSGALDNGLAYFVRRNPEPKHRAELRLAVDVGSVAETDAQRGVAHIVEHLGFQATERFESHQIVAFLEAIGARFGACQNAYTSVEETVYSLHVPVDQPELLARALDVLQQFAFSVRCSDADVEHERGPVLEEWRSSRTASGRSADAMFQAVMAGSHYAERLPIGQEEVIRHCDPATVRSFYRDWYHPERMAIVVVGDLEEEGLLEVEEMIRSRFSVSPKAPFRPMPRHEVPLNGAPVDVNIFSDAEVTSTNVSVDCRLPGRATTTEADFREDLLRWLLIFMVDRRLGIVALNPPAPFFNAAASESSVVRCLDTFGVSARATEGRAMEALRGLLDEVERAKVHGFSAAELAVAQANARVSWRTSFVERNHTASATFCDDLVASFLDGSVACSVEYLYELATRTLATITAEELQEGLHRLLDWSSDCLVAITEPTSAPTTEAEVRAVLAAARAGREALAPWRDEEEVRLFDTPPAPGAVSAEATHALGVAARDGEGCAPPLQEWGLENGLTVAVQPTDFLEDDVTFQLFAPGGLSQLGSSNCFEGRYACALADELGCWGARPHALVDFLGDTQLQVRADVGIFYSRAAGSGSPADMVKLFQMLNKLFTETPKVRRDVVQQLMEMMQQDVHNRASNPYSTFNDAVSRVNSGNHWLYRPVTEERLRQFDTKESMAFFRERFANPAGFRLVLVGNVDVEAAKELSRVYLASIPPVAGPVLKGADVKELVGTFPSHLVREDLRVPMQEAMSSAQLTVAVDVPAFDEADPWGLSRFVLRLNLVAQLLQTKLLQHLRFALGRVYSVSVSANCTRKPLERGTSIGALYVSFDCAPEETDLVLDACLEELRAIARQGPSASDVATLQEVAIRDHEELVRTNGFWADLVESCYISQLYAGDVGDVARGWQRCYAELLENGLSQADVAAASAHALALLDRRSTIVTIRPVERDVKRLRVAGLVAAGALLAVSYLRLSPRR